MQDKNGTGEPKHAAACRNCGKAIQDYEDAIYDGAEWFCGPRCHGQHLGNLSGNVPA